MRCLDTFSIWTLARHFKVKQSGKERDELPRFDILDGKETVANAGVGRCPPNQGARVRVGGEMHESRGLVEHHCINLCECGGVALCLATAEQSRGEAPLGHSGSGGESSVAHQNDLSVVAWVDDCGMGRMKWRDMKRRQRLDDNDSTTVDDDEGDY